MKLALCTIIKNENLYLREWVEYYKKLGFYKIYLYDNNDVNCEYPHMVIGDYINDGFVVYHNWRGVKDDVSQITELETDKTSSIRRKSQQYTCYEECFDKYKEECDWMFFLDTDEFIWVHNDDFIWEMKNLDPEINEIWFYWEMIGDGDQLYYSPRPVRERFKNAKRFIPKEAIKYGIRSDSTGYNADFGWKNNVVHVTDQDNYAMFNTDVVKLEHYVTKSVSEYFSKKLSSGYVNNEYVLNEYNAEAYMNKMLELFSTYSDITYNKRKIANNIFNNYIKNKK